MAVLRVRAAPPRDAAAASDPTPRRPARYQVAGTRAVLAGRSFRVGACTGARGVWGSRAECPRVAQAEIEYQPVGGDGKPVRRSGRFKAVNVALIPCITPDAKLGMAPGKSLNDGAARLIMVQHCWRWRFLQFLTRVAGRKDQFALPFVDAVDVTAIPSPRLPAGGCGQRAAAGDAAAAACAGAPRELEPGRRAHPGIRL